VKAPPALFCKEYEFPGFMREQRNSFLYLLQDKLEEISHFNKRLLSRKEMIR
jgi:hypothetical protein